MNIKIKIVDKLNEKLDVNELSRIYIFFNRILDVYKVRQRKPLNL